jgi:enoyl-CoA hydratase/carnithine racemase
MFRLDHDGDVARLTLDRPATRNAIPAGGWASLSAVIAEVARSDARLLVLSGAGTAFCAGADLGDFPAMHDDAPARTHFRTEMRAAIDALAALPIPTIAAIHGACYGAGVALAMACDLRVTTPAARFAITPAKVGISYPQEDVHRMVALVGAGQAARLLFTAAAIDGAEAAQIGLVELHDPEGGVAALVEAILASDSDSLATLKRGIGLGRATDEEQDRRFDALIGGDAMAQRLEAMWRK